MSFRVSSVGPASVNQYIGQAQTSIEDSIRKIASGSRVSRPSDDPAGFAVSENLRTQIRSTAQAGQNAQNAQSILQTAEGGLNEQGNILGRLRELAVNAASDTVGDTERGYLNTEFTQLSQEFDRIAKSTKYGDRELLTGSGQDLEFQVGAGATESDVVKFKMDVNTTASKAGIGGLTIDDKGSARGALENIDSAMETVNGARANFGAAQSRLQYSIDNLGSSFESLSAARSTVADTDIAAETTKLARAQMQQQASVSVAAQANQSAGRVLQLLN